MEIVCASAKPDAKRVLIVSTYKTRCGMASHAEVLISHLKDLYALDVFPLDQFVLRSRDKRVNDAGNKAIKRMCAKLRDYDAVILQWEPEFWGASHKQILKRVKMFTQNVSRLIFVNHTVMSEPAILSFNAVRSIAGEYGVSSAVTYVRDAIRGFHSRLYNLFKAVDRRRELTVIAHTRRDRRFLEMVVGFSDVRDHPLFHIRHEWRDAIERDAKAARREMESIYGKDVVFIATFGFLTDHKSIDTAVTAMRYLPKNYKLLIYGGVHPNTIKEREPVNPYVKSLTSSARGDVASLMKFAPTSLRSGSIQGTPVTNEAIKNIFLSNLPVDDRVIFMSSPDDYEFAVAIGACDVAVLPYLEIGQSASGPASQVLELGARLVSTTARPFSEIDRIFPNRISMFDIGNYMQLAVAIKNALTKPKHAPFSLEKGSWTQRDFYVAAIEDNIAKASGARREAAE